MGRAGRDCGQFHPDGVLSCTTELLSQHSPLASHTRMDTAQKSPPKSLSVACYVVGPMSESAFLRRKVARTNNVLPLRCLVNGRDGLFSAITKVGIAPMRPQTRNTICWLRVKWSADR